MPWFAIAAGISALSSYAQSRRSKYTYEPNATWLAMREDVMRGISEGLAAGGYTWSEEIGEKLYRGAQEDIGREYAGATERVREATAPYGAIGAMGREITGIEIGEAQEKARAGRELDIAREEQKLTSFSSLLQQGGQIGDPNLPGAQMEFQSSLMQQPTGAGIGRGIETGLATYLNLQQAEKQETFYQDWLRTMQQRKGSGVTALDQPSYYTQYPSPLQTTAY